MNEHQIKILIVDDNTVNIKVLSQYLLKQGYEVITAESGEEAIEKYESEAPDIILMDIMLGGMNGLEATAKIKSLTGDKWVPVILYSDGLVEAENSEGKAFDEDMLLEVLKTNELGSKLRNNIVDAVTSHLDGEKSHDDMSLVVLNTQLDEEHPNV